MLKMQFQYGIKWSYNTILQNLWDSTRRRDSSVIRAAINIAKGELVTILDTMSDQEDPQDYLTKVRDSLKDIEVALNMTDSELANVDKISKFLGLM
jgi:hypothetical protein